MRSSRQGPGGEHARRRRARWPLRLAAPLLAGGLLGCQQSTPGAPVFNDEGGRPLTCMAHQTHRPTSAYNGGDRANTELVLAMLAYYRTNGTKPYCDRKPATEADVAWTRLYVESGGARDNVAPNLR